MSDLISRHDAIDALCDNCDYPQSVCAHYPCGQYVSIEQLPSASQQWIPVSERLPHSREEVIVSICDETGDTRYNYTSHGWLTTDKEYWIVDDEINNYVVAWMPLPEPWRGEER